MGVYDFQGYVASLPGVQRVFMADAPRTGNGLTDYSPNAKNGNFNYLTGGSSDQNYNAGQPAILRRQIRQSFSCRARDCGGRGVGNFFRNTTGVSLQNSSFWTVAVPRITALDQRHAVLGYLSVAAGGAGNAFALLVNPDGSVSCGFDTAFANLAKSAAGIVQPPYAPALIAYYNYASGVAASQTLTVWCNVNDAFTQIINVTNAGASQTGGITNATTGQQIMGGLHLNAPTTTITSTNSTVSTTQLDPTATQVTVASATNFSPSGGLFGVVKSPLPTSPTIASQSGGGGADPTQDWYEVWAYTGVSGSTLTGVTPVNGETVNAQGTYPCPVTIYPYYATFRRGFLGPWAIGTGALTDSQGSSAATVAQAMMQRTGLLDTDINPVFFSQRTGHRNLPLPNQPTLDANTAQFAAQMNGYYAGNNFLNTAAFTEQLHFVDNTTPAAQVINHHNTPGSNNTSITGDLSAGSAVIQNVSSTSALVRNMVLNNANWAPNGVARIISISGTTVTMDTQSQGTQIGATIQYGTIGLNACDLNLHELFRSVPIPTLAPNGQPWSDTVVSAGPGGPNNPPKYENAGLGAKGTDHDCVIVDRKHGMMWALWRPYPLGYWQQQKPQNYAGNVAAYGEPINLGDGLWHSSWGGAIFDLDGWGDAAYGGGVNTNANYSWGPSASSQESLGGLITIAEATSGYIPHILDIACSNNAAAFRWPAPRTDGTATGTLAVTTTAGQSTITSTATSLGGLAAGMPIYGPNLPAGASVKATSGSSGNYTITMQTGQTASSSGAMTLTWYPLQEGTVFRLRPDLVLNSALIPNRLGLAMAIAIQNYGMKLRDTNSGSSWAFYAEPGDAYINTLGYNPWTGQGMSTTFTATTDGTTAVLTGVSSTSWWPGQGNWQVSGNGIPNNAQVVSVNPSAGTVTISAPTTSPNTAATITVAPQIVPVADTLVGGSTFSNLIPTSVFTGTDGSGNPNLQIVDANWYQTYSGRLRNYDAGRHR